MDERPGPNEQNPEVNGSSSEIKEAKPNNETNIEAPKETDEVKLGPNTHLSLIERIQVNQARGRVEKSKVAYNQAQEALRNKPGVGGMAYDGLNRVREENVVIGNKLEDAFKNAEEAYKGALGRYNQLMEAIEKKHSSK